MKASLAILHRVYIDIIIACKSPYGGVVIAKCRFEPMRQSALPRKSNWNTGIYSEAYNSCKCTLYSSRILHNPLRGNRLNPFGLQNPAVIERNPFPFLVWTLL